MHLPAPILGAQAFAEVEPSCPPRAGQATCQPVRTSSLDISKALQRQEGK